MRPASRFMSAVAVIVLTVFLWTEGRIEARAAELDSVRIGGDYSYLKAPAGRGAKWCEKRCRLDARCKSWTFVKPRRQCRLKRLVAPLISNKCCVSGAKKKRKSRTRRQLCADFASEAVDHQDENLAKGCGYVGDPWSDDYKLQFRACMLMTPVQQRASFLGRKRALKRCDQVKKKLNTQCRRFALDAVTLAAAVSRNNCSVNPQPWIYGYKQALDWCRENRDKANEDAFKKVRKEFASCLKYGGGPYIKRCDDYARAAIKQYIKARSKECGLRGRLWSKDYKHHYQYCLKVEPWDLENSRQNRKVELQRCEDQAGESNEGKVACDHYSRLASEQTRSNRKYRCGLKGRRWLADYDRHYAWCKTTSKSNRDQELKYRERELSKCFERAGGELIEACDDYAVRSVRQYGENIKKNCNYRGGDWHNSYQRHYKWCVKARSGQAQRRLQRRKRALQTCRRGF